MFMLHNMLADRIYQAFKFIHQQSQIQSLFVLKIVLRNTSSIRCEILVIQQNHTELLDGRNK